MNTRKYEAVPGFFVQDSPDHESSFSSPEKAVSLPLQILPGFGLIDTSPDRWTTFSAAVQNLNRTAPRGVQYKVFFLGRHGEGYHNYAWEKYGAQAWDEYWSKLHGDGEILWGPDPHLTPLGEKQAQEAHSAWVTERRFGVPLPEKFYTSPMTRAIRTHKITFDGLIASDIQTTIVENIREQAGIHTCDKRGTRSEIHEAFPEYMIEDGFTEADTLWDPNYRETHDDVDRRVTSVLDMIFQKDSEQFISITAHGGFVSGFLRVCHHRPWFLATGGTIPVVVKGSMVDQDGPNLLN